MTVITMGGHYRGRRSAQLGASPTMLPTVLPAPVEHLSPSGRSSNENKRTKPVHSLLASAQRLTRKGDDKSSSPSPAGSGGGGVSVAKWQEEAWGMYDLVGEQRYLANTLANQLGKARIYVGRHSENGEGIEEADLPPEVVRAFDSFGGSASARSQMITRLGVNLFIAGDGWLVGIPKTLLEDDYEAKPTPNDTPFLPKLKTVDRTTPQLSENDAVRVAASDDDDALTWRMLSVSEVATVDEDTAKITLPEDGGRTIEAPLDELYLIRVWRPHPRRAWEADSPTRASLPVLRELVGLSMHVSAQVDSRLAGAGILTVPQSVTRALAASAGVPEDSDEDLVTESLMLAMETAIKDREAASALVPLVLTIPDESAGKIDHITFSTPLDSEARNLRDEAIRRLALSQDAPPEVLLGTGDMNHWGAWLVQEETVSTHLEPPLSLICDALTSEYLRPVLEALGVDDPDQYVVAYDVDALVSSPTRGQDAQSAYSLGVLSDKAVREALGFEETDGPFTLEGEGQEGGKPLSRSRITAYEMVRADPNLFVSPGLGALVDQLDKLLGNKPLDPTPIGTDAPETPTEDGPSTPAGDGDPEEPAQVASPGKPTQVGEADLSPEGPLSR